MIPRNQKLPIYFHDGYLRLNAEENRINLSPSSSRTQKVSLHRNRVYYSASYITSTVWLLFFCCCWWPRVLRIKHSLFKSRARIQITRKYPLSSSGFTDFRLSYLQPLALVAPLPRTKKSVKKCIINATRGERSDSTHHNLDYLYITGLEGTEWLHSLKDNRLFRCLKLNSNKLPVRKQAQQVQMSYLDGRWSVKRHTAVSSGIP